MPFASTALPNALEQCYFATHPFRASASHARCRNLLAFLQCALALKAPG